MSFAKKFNTTKAHFTFVPNENTPFVKPVDLVGQNGINKVYMLKGCYINKKGLYGDEPVLISDTFFVNAPTYLCETINTVLNDEASINLINHNKVGFKFYQYENKFGKQLAIEWVDL